MFLIAPDQPAITTRVPAASTLPSATLNGSSGRIATCTSARSASSPFHTTRAGKLTSFRFASNATRVSDSIFTQCAAVRKYPSRVIGTAALSAPLASFFQLTSIFISCSVKDPETLASFACSSSNPVRLTAFRIVRPRSGSARSSSARLGPLRSLSTR